MATTYSQLQSQIAKLQEKANRLRDAEVAGVVRKIQAAISAYSLTKEDLFEVATSKSSARKRTTSRSQSTSEPKFSDGVGNTWVGRGPRPLWLREALAAGKTISEFAVDKGARAKLTTSPRKSEKNNAAKRAANPAKKRVAAKCRDQAGNTWSGRGSQPRWLRKALAAGTTLDQLAV